MRRFKNVVWVAAATVGVASCTDYESATDLRPEGPPMITQIRMVEVYDITAGVTSERTVFAFGDHEMAPEAEKHPVTRARARANKLRIIVDELLVGNNLEEIQCRGQVDSDAYQRVPLGATPDDIARCAVQKDVLPQTCTGPKAVCICELDGGCTVDGELVEKGKPVGVQDLNHDGSADDTRFIQGAVAIQCGNIDVPIDLDKSYWNPSGTQQVPATGGFDALGPAIVLETAANGLPTGQTCHLVFADDIVDKQGERICAPPNGDVTAGCTPGDVSAFSFTVETLAFSSEPQDGATGWSREEPAVLIANANIDNTTLTGIEVENVTAGTTLVAGTDYTAAVVQNRQIRVNWTNLLDPNTQYRITVPTTVTDMFGQGLEMPLSISFTTGTN
jgi:hypothetical protein